MEGYGNENPGAFQSTRPLRGATPAKSTLPQRRNEFQPTRPLRGATPTPRDDAPPKGISTHAPLAGRDAVCFGADVVSAENFNPRAPCGARRNSRRSCLTSSISTHAPLAGRDSQPTQAGVDHSAFQPTRPLRGATISGGRSTQRSPEFQPTRPLRGATISGGRSTQRSPEFQPTLRREILRSTFQPTRPLRGATTLLR